MSGKVRSGKIRLDNVRSGKVMLGQIGHIGNSQKR